MSGCSIEEIASPYVLQHAPEEIPENSYKQTLIVFRLIGDTIVRENNVSQYQNTGLVTHRFSSS